MIWRVSIFVYLLLGGAFIAWNARRWWIEMESSAHDFSARLEGVIPQRVSFVILIMLSLISLMFDIVLWPRCAWIAWKQWRKRRRWEEHGDFCHCEDCDGDD